MTMTLKQEELELIGEYVQRHLTEWLPEKINAQPNNSFPIELTERIIRVEEELKSQRELMIIGFDQIDKRFEQVDKRFEQMQHNVDKRFEQVDKRFEQVDKRFEQMQNYMDKNFNEVKLSIKSLETKMFQFMVWSFGFTATVAGIVIAVIKFV